MKMYPEEVLNRRDNHGRTMMNYLFDHGTIKSFEVLGVILRRTVVEKLEPWGLDEKRWGLLDRFSIPQMKKLIPSAANNWLRKKESAGVVHAIAHMNKEAALNPRRHPSM